MNFIWDKITEWLKGLLVGGIVSNLSGLFDSINTRVADVASTVGKTPQAWNGSIFSMIKSLSENVVVPIAGIILTFVMCLELIQLLIDRNNMHDFETFIFFKWIFKTFAAVLIVTNTWNIVMGVFDVAQHVVSQAAGVIIGETALDVSTLIGDMEARLMEMDIGPLFGLWFQSSLMGIIAWVLSICIFIIVYGRMIEIYMVTSVAPIPMATMVNREWGQMGQNYLRSLFALGFQAFVDVDGTYVNPTTLLATVENQPAPGRIKILKQDELDKHVIAGVQFDIFTVDADGNPGDLVAKMTTGKDGIAESPDLFPADYIVREHANPTGYVDQLWSEKITVGMDEIVTRTVTNMPVQGKIRIVKTDSETGKGLPGAVFTVTRISGLPSHNGENDGEIVAVITSGADGTAETPLLTWGEYQIVETRVPDDYLDDGYSVTVRIPAEVKTDDTQAEETADPVK